MEDYGKNKKRVVMKCYDHTHAKLLIKLKEYKIKQHDFFMQFIDSFVNDDPVIRQWIENHPNIVVKKKHKRVRKQEDKAIKKIEEQYNFDQIELDNIFDIIEEENGVK